MNDSSLYDKKAGPPVLCTSFCNKLKYTKLAPMRTSPWMLRHGAYQWISNGIELCRVAGFSVKSLSDEPEEVSCYGGKSSVDFIADSWRASQSKVQEKTDSSGFVEDVKKLVKDMTFKERISWAVGGMVLTAGLLFTSVCMLNDITLHHCKFTFTMQSKEKP
ncbi:hypothetical protein A4A49_53335 [Nicotiana attenuata]|uniref:Transmembrane protein n=1 Tax=Nicotiana attenuata TaxID=49451 RepID=A0A1J6JVQ5_NICAT|nr:hypothetical protein A4A49_53335 [Nicotiana attenuata]